jgi:hypothetical protein
MNDFTESTMADLMRRRKVLCKKIKQLQAVPSFDSLEMTRLKTEKLEIKRQIAACGDEVSGTAQPAPAPAQETGQGEDSSSAPDFIPATSVVFLNQTRPVNESSERPARAARDGLGT